MIINIKRKGKIINNTGSLTVEAALVLPIFIYFILAFLYFIQIFTTQEMIQKSITKLGLDTAKHSYIISEYIDESLLKFHAESYVDIDTINNSCIVYGWDGVSFQGSSVLDQDNCVDIVVSYYIRIPIKLLQLKDIPMVQRVRLKSWLGTSVDPSYTKKEENSQGDREDIRVFITDTGTVYHRRRDCSHINIKVSAVNGIPTEQRNYNGAKYYPCDRCIMPNITQDTYYITTNGNRYHSSVNCSGLKRTITEVSLSEVSDKRPCKRCTY